MEVGLFSQLGASSLRFGIKPFCQVEHAYILLALPLTESVVYRNKILNNIDKFYQTVAPLYRPNFALTEVSCLQRIVRRLYGRS
jgi:hypothetical protein